MNKKKYMETRAKLMDEAQAFINSGDADKAQEKMNEVKALDEKWDAAVQAQADFTALNKEPDFKPPIGMEDKLDTAPDQSKKDQTPEELWDSQEYVTAWAKMMQDKKLTDREKEVSKLVNEAFTHNTDNTSVVIPKTVSNKIWELAGEMYPYFEDCQKTYVNGILTVVMEDTSSESKWYDEGTKTEDGKETFKEVTLSGCELARNITVSWKLREMAMDDFIPYIQRKMAKKMGAAVGYGATHGQGKKTANKPEPVGVVTALENEEGTPQIIEYSGTPTFTDITKLRSLIKSGYAAGLRLYANSKTIWNKIVNIVDTNKRPIFMPDASTGGYKVLGMEVKEDDSMLDGEILLSNAFAGYHANINKNISMMTEEHVKDRQTDYCAYAIIDGNVITEKAHALLKEKKAVSGS